MSNADRGRQYRKRRTELPDPYGFPCPFCRQLMLYGQRLQTDHAVPVILGGTDSPLRWSHGHCNESVGASIGNRLRARRRLPRPNSQRFG